MTRRIQRSNRSAHDSHFDDFDRDFKRITRFGIAAWLIGAVLTLAFWALVAWGIYELVIWVTSH